MEKPSIQELTEVIKDLPMKKAAGPSQITYEMLKNLSIKAKKDSTIYFTVVILQVQYLNLGKPATYILYLRTKIGERN